MTSTVPVPAGAVAVREVPAPLIETLVAGLAPKLTVAPPRLAPFTVTVVPPVEGPAGGAIDVTVGGATTVRTTIVGAPVGT